MRWAIASLLVAGLSGQSLWPHASDASPSPVEAALARRRLSSRHPTTLEIKEWRRQHEHLERERASLLAIDTPLTYALAHPGWRPPLVAPAAKTGRNATGSRREKLRIGVCVIGQMSRLELSSKLRHALEPLSLHYTVDVVMPLSARKRTHFVNKQTDVGGRKDWTEGLVKSRIRAALRVRNGTTNGAVILDSSPQDASPLLHFSYVVSGDKYDKLADKEERVRSHVRQWGALWRCYKHFVRLEKAGGAPYSGFIKLRDDSLFLKPLVSMRKPAFFKGFAIFKNCNAFDGLNDKVAVLDASFAYAFFAAPLLDWYFNFTAVQHAGPKLKNPESYLLAVMKGHRVRLRRVSADVLPIVTSRVQNNRATATCIPLQRPKIGWGAHCLPEDCDVRKRVFCSRCPEEDSPSEEAEHKRIVLKGCIPAGQIDSWTCARHNSRLASRRNHRQLQALELG